MDYKKLVKHATILYRTGFSEDKRACAEKAVMEMIPAVEIGEAANNFDITLDDIVDFVYSQMRSVTKSGGKNE